VELKARQEAEARQAREIEEAKTRVPNLLGKTFRQIVDMWGEPTKIEDIGTVFDWWYDEKPRDGYRTLIFFYDNSLYNTMGAKVKRAHSISVDLVGQTPRYAQEILPPKLLSEKPVRIYLYPDDNLLCIYWAKGGKQSMDCYYRGFKSYAEAKVGGPGNPVYRQSTKLDTDSGVNKSTYEVSADWQGCFLQSFEQCDSVGKMAYNFPEEKSRCIRVK